MGRTLCLAAVLALPIRVEAAAMADGEERRLFPYVGKTGRNAPPEIETARPRWSCLGTWAVQGADGAAESHTVYTWPSTVDAYRKTGRVPDGTIPVSEVRKPSSCVLDDRNPRSDDVIWWFVMFKDSRGRYAGNPRRAQGWARAQFFPGNPAKDFAAIVRSDCMACPERTQNADRVYREVCTVFED